MVWKLSSFIFFVFALYASAVLLPPNACDYTHRALALGDAGQRLHGGMPLHPVGRSMLSAFLNRTRVAHAIRKFSLVDDPSQSRMKHVIAIGPKEFPEFIKLFSQEFPHLVQNVHAPNTDTYNHLMFRGTDFTRHGATDFRFPAEGTIAPVLLLSSSEAARLHDFLYLIQRYGQQFTYPWTVPGYGYPADPYYNCGSWPPHIPLGDKVTSKVLVSKNVDNHGRAQSNRRGMLQTPPVPAQMVLPGDREIFQRVWSAPIHERLWDLLDLSWEEGNGSSTSNFAQSLSVLATNERVPFIVYYTKNPKEIPSPFDAQFYDWSGN